jgi:hypothetical protein
MGIALERSKRASRPCRVVSVCSEAVMGFEHWGIGALGQAAGGLGTCEMRGVAALGDGIIGGVV